MWTTNVSAYFDPLYDFRLVNIMIERTDKGALRGSGGLKNL